MANNSFKNYNQFRAYMKMRLNFVGYSLYIEVGKKRKAPQNTASASHGALPAKLNFGPGPNWTKPDNSWLSVDVDPDLGDIVVNFQDFERLPLPDRSVECVYGSHVFEHMSIFSSQLVFNEIHRVLQPGGIARIIVPDVEKSMREYLNGNTDFPLFRRRRERAKKNQAIDYTLFECMKEDFLSPSGQTDLLGRRALAHQNAWDFETLVTHLQRAGFKHDAIRRMNFQESQTPLFSFEGTYPSEANEDYRSLYVEAVR